MRRRTDKKLVGLDGNKWRQSHQATVDSVLNKYGEYRKVFSRGHSFFNRDNWTARAFAAALCEWARLNPASTPDRSDVEGWVIRANQSAIHPSDKCIVIASTPDDLPRWLAYALVGGGYHEAWHTVYSRRTRIHISEVWPKVRDLWNLVPYAPDEGKHGWAGLATMVLHWGNIIEDIRIERVGCVDYPGAPSKMEALQDLILQQEEEGREAASAHRAMDANDSLSVVVGTFRDLGLGYETPSQQAALRKYQDRSAEGYTFVTSGPLKPLLDRSIALGAKDDMDHLWLAMEVVAEIVKTSQKPEEPEEQDGDGDGDEGEGQPQPQQGQQQGQPEASDVDTSGEGEGQEISKDQLLVFKKGDRAKLKAGPNKGRTVEVVKAHLPHPETGVQRLEFALVEEA